MRLLELHCQSFRCLDGLRFEPGAGLNVIRGGNAQGKTSVLEAILFAATSKSHRTNNEEDLVRHGAESFHIAVSAERADRSVRIEANWWQGAKRFKVNGVAQARVSDILGRLHVVFFSPEDIELVKGGAGERRRFLDMELSQVDASYLASLQQYRQVLRQRNELLRGGHPDPDLFAAWDTQLAAHGGALIAARRSFLLDLAPLAAEAHARIADGELLALEYNPDVEDAENLLQMLERNRASDIRRGTTGRGPHRDEVRLSVAGHPARSHGSQGQQRTAALSLKLAELQLVKRRTGEYPVLMLDEVLAELDASRADSLFDAIPSEVQCIMTTTDASPSSALSERPCRVFQIERGHLDPA